MSGKRPDAESSNTSAPSSLWVGLLSDSTPRRVHAFNNRKHSSSPAMRVLRVFVHVSERGRTAPRGCSSSHSCTRKALQWLGCVHVICQDDMTCLGQMESGGKGPHDLATSGLRRRGVGLSANSSASLGLVSSSVSRASKITTTQSYTLQKFR
jgi:hypothetical protein